MLPKLKSAESSAMFPRSFKLLVHTGNDRQHRISIKPLRSFDSYEQHRYRVRYLDTLLANTRYQGSPYDIEKENWRGLRVLVRSIVHLSAWRRLSSTLTHKQLLNFIRGAALL